jgi:hypothetical protein
MNVVEIAWIARTLNAFPVGRFTKATQMVPSLWFRLAHVARTFTKHLQQKRNKGPKETVQSLKCIEIFATQFKLRPVYSIHMQTFQKHSGPMRWCNKLGDFPGEERMFNSSWHRPCYFVLPVSVSRKGENIYFVLCIPLQCMVYIWL